MSLTPFSESPHCNNNIHESVGCRSDRGEGGLESVEGVHAVPVMPVDGVADGERDGIDDGGGAAESLELNAEVGEEAERIHSLPSYQPTKSEYDDHCVSHSPYRPWCKHCVRGKAKGRQSRRLSESDSESRHPRIRLDYCVMTDRSEEESGEDEGGEMNEEEKKEEAREVGPGDEAATSPSITILVLQESGNRSILAYEVQSKGASEAWVVDQIVEDLDTAGLRNDKVVVKSDQEPAIQELARAVARSRETDYGSAIGASAVGDSDSNASIERAIQDVQAQVRTLRSALEERISARVHIKAQIVGWTVRHAACLIYRF